MKRGLRRWRLAAAAVAWTATAAGAVSIATVTPQGEVAQVRQVTVRFDAPVVALGDPRLPPPVKLECQGPTPAGTGGWADDRNWTYDFRAPLPPGVRCTVSAKAGWQPLNGPLTGRTEFVFQTGGPAVADLEPGEDATIEEDQHFLLRLTGAATDSSVAANAWCEVEGIGEKVPVRVVSGAARDELLRNRGGAKSAERRLLLACQRPLPADARVRLVWGAGIAAQGNPKILTRTPQTFEFRVRKAFHAEFSCERERAQAPCLPIRPLRLNFSSPVPREAAQQVRLKPQAGGSALAPAFDKDDKSAEVDGLSFPVPLAENARYTLEIPATLKDSSGRPLANAASFPLAVATGGAPPIAKFAAAPFGILEWRSEPALPVTLRHVQGDLRPAANGGQVRVLRLQEPADMLAWLRRVRQMHERDIKARDAGLPESRWTETVTEEGPNGKPVKRRVDRYVGTREVSLLQQEPRAKRLELPALQGGDPRPFEVIGIPLPEPGLHVVEIQSRRLGEALLEPKGPMYIRSAALVTNLGVHLKVGRENSLVWVTTLDRAQPVADAEVALLDCGSQLLWTGRTDAQGRARIEQPLEHKTRSCPDEHAFVAFARKADATGTVDTAFVFSSWNHGIDPWRFNLPLAHGPTAELAAHTVFDRTLLRAGETVSMKHFVRAETSRGLSPLAPQDLPSRARIRHEGSGQEVTVPLQWAAARSATSSWNIPANAKLGSYSVTLEREHADPSRRTSLSSGSFRVEEFRLPLVDARLVAPKATVVAPQELPVDIQMQYLSGGGVSQAPLRGTAQLNERTPSYPAWPDFSFEPPRERTSRPAEPSADEDDSEAPARPGRLVADKQPLTTDRNGAARWVIKGLPKLERPAELRAEITYSDPNGEVQTASTRVPLWPSAVVVGLKTGAWASSRGQVSFSALALDTEGKALKGQAIEVRARLAQTISSRKRMVGGFYAYDNRTEVKDLGVLCSGSTDARGLLLCEAQLDNAGEVELVAQAKDSAGHVAQAAASVWVTRQGELWFAQDNDDRIDVLPEKKFYEPGDTARLQVRMPFREATALVAIEREGVIDTRIVTLRGSDPTLELKIEPAWGPNVYVSVLAVRGRVRDVPWYSFFSWGWKSPLDWARAYWHEGRAYQAPTAMVDLSKPAYKFGVAALKVGIAAHTLKVQVSADKPQYTIRGKALARVQVTQGGKPAADAEVAFAAVDESLLALKSNESWQLLEAMIRERGWGVQTATAQSEVIGRRHYGRKAVAAGGGGGRAGARELFDTLLVWQPSVKLDAKGEALVEVPLNDSLTSFRLVAVADAGVQAFGTGHTSIRVTQDLQALAGLPPLVREGDRYQAMVTLRNTTGREMKLRATLTGTVHSTGAAGASSASVGASGPDFARAPLALPPQELTLAANSARELQWTVDVPVGAFSIAWEAAAEEIGGPAVKDRVKFTQFVKEAVPVRVMQATLQALDQPLSLPVAAPADALPGQGTKRGGLAVALQPRLTGALPGVRRYFETYPFACLEQKTSKAVGLRDTGLWQAVANALPTYLDKDGLAAYFPPREGDPPQGSDRLTAHVLSLAQEAGFALPDEAREAMLAGLSAYVQGRIERRFWSPKADADVRKLSAMAALARHGRAQARWLGSIRLEPNAWPTAAVIDWLTILQRVADVPDRAARLAEAQQILRARLQMSGTTLRFSQEEDDFWWWLMDSADANAARLILAVIDEPAWKDDLPRLMVGHLGRQKAGAWLTTTANVWSAVALDRFAAKFEAVRVGGQTRANTGGSSLSHDWQRQPDGGRMLLPWPAAAGNLSVAHEGPGRPWVTVQSLAAVPLKAPLQRGYAITRTVTAVEQAKAGAWSRGDTLRVKLEVDAQADMTWVVISDPVPAGATVLGSGLGRDSAIATAGERREGSAWPAYEERSFEAFRSYYGYLPRGKHVVEYTLRLNNAGRFALPPTRVEAMYAPESFGETPNAPLEVGP